MSKTPSWADWSGKAAPAPARPSPPVTPSQRPKTSYGNGPLIFATLLTVAGVVWFFTISPMLGIGALIGAFLGLPRLLRQNSRYREQAAGHQRCEDCRSRLKRNAKGTGYAFVCSKCGHRQSWAPQPTAGPRSAPPRPPTPPAAPKVPPAFTDEFYEK